MINQSEVLIPFLTCPTFIPHLNPRQGRMYYQNMITNEKNATLQFTFKDFLSITTAGKGNKGRIFIGPKNFINFFDWRFDITTCTIEELVKEFKRTYPKDMICDVEKNLNTTPTGKELPVVEEKAWIDDYLERHPELNADTRKEKEKGTITEVTAPIDPYAIDHSKD